MTELDRLLSDVNLVATLPDGLELVLLRVNELELPPSETLEELKRALAIAFAAACRLKFEAAGCGDGCD